MNESVPITGKERVKGVESPEFRAAGVQYQTNGISIDITPPGRVLRQFNVNDLTVKVVPQGVTDTGSMCSVNGKKIDQCSGTGTAGVLHLFPYGKEAQIDCVNGDWGCIFQFDADRLQADVAKRIKTEGSSLRAHARRTDATAGVLGRMAIDHLRYEPKPDAMYLEGLSLAVTARVFDLVGPEASLPLTPLADPRLLRAIEYIEDNISSALSVADCAAVAAMSPTWFARSFKAARGVAVHSYVRERRLQRALDLLGHSHISLTNIAHECGFSDQSHLTRSFSKRFGMPPNAWRNR